MKTLTAIMGIVARANKGFDAAVVGKVARISAVVCVIEFLLAVTWTMWTPVDSRCAAPSSANHGPLVALGLLAFWTCIIAVLWKDAASLISGYLALLGTGDIQAESTPGIRLHRPSTLVLIAVFFLFAAFGAVLTITMIKTIVECG
jgi:hypothetical protein